MILHQLIERHEKMSPHREALVDASGRESFAELAHRARKLGAALHALGVRHQDRVAVVLTNCNQFAELYVACEIAGFIIVPINTRLAPAEMTRILTDCTPRVVIFETEFAETLRALRDNLPTSPEFVCIGGAENGVASFEAMLGAASAEGPPTRGRPEDLIEIIYTSGTTGQPKGVMRTQAADAALADCIGREISITPESRTLITMPLFHMGGRGLQLAQHWIGGTCIIHKRFDPNSALDCIELERVTHAHFAPTMLQDLLDAADRAARDLSSLKTISYGAAPMSVPFLRRAMSKVGRIFVNLYGATESHVTCLGREHHSVDGSDQSRKRLGSVGQVSIGGEMRILDDEDNEVGVGTPGEIAARAPWMSAGYWNRSGETIESFRNGWVRFGDIGVQDEFGFLYLVDRKKDMIISGGENIYSREVEMAILEHTEVVDVAVIGVSDERWGEAVKAVVMRKENSALDAEGLIAHCRSLIARYKCPKSVDFVPQLPRLPSGKIAKVELRARYARVQIETK